MFVCGTGAVGSCLGGEDPARAVNETGVKLVAVDPRGTLGARDQWRTQFRRLYYRVAKKHGKNMGRVAVARALKHQETFRPIGQGATRQRPGVMAG